MQCAAPLHCALTPTLRLLQVGAVINFSCVWLLAPTAGAAGAASTGLVQRLLSDEFLLKWAAPTSHMFQPGFPLAKRVLNFGYKGFVFALIGGCREKGAFRSRGFVFALVGGAGRGRATIWLLKGFVVVLIGGRR